MSHCQIALKQHRPKLWICRGLFATQYHRLAESHDQDPNVAICHMGCSVADSVDGGPEQFRALFASTSMAFIHMCSVLPQALLLCKLNTHCVCPLCSKTPTLFSIHVLACLSAVQSVVVCQLVTHQHALDMQSSIDLLTLTTLLLDSGCNSFANHGYVHAAGHISLQADRWSLTKELWCQCCTPSRLA